MNSHHKGIALSLRMEIIQFYCRRKLNSGVHELYMCTVYNFLNCISYVKIDLVRIHDLSLCTIIYNLRKQ